MSRARALGRPAPSIVEECAANASTCANVASQKRSRKGSCADVPPAILRRVIHSSNASSFGSNTKFARGRDLCFEQVDADDDEDDNDEDDNDNDEDDEDFKFKGKKKRRKRQEKAAKSQGKAGNEEPRWNPLRSMLMDKTFDDQLGSPVCPFLHFETSSLGLRFFKE